MNVQSFRGDRRVHFGHVHREGQRQQQQQGQRRGDADLVQELVKFDLRGALKKIFPKAADDFLMREISEFFDQNRDYDEGRPLTEPEILAWLTERLLGVDVPEEMDASASDSAAAPSASRPRRAGIYVLPQNGDVIEDALREELVETLRKIFPLTRRGFLVAEIEKVISSMGNEERKLETLIHRFFQISSIPKDNKTGLKVFDSTMQASDHPEDVLYPAPAPIYPRQFGGANCNFECGCCFVSSKSSVKVLCLRNHAFCQSCIKRYVDFIISGEGSSTFACMAQGCSADFAKTQVQFLDPLCLKQLEDRRQNEDVAKALAASDADEQLCQCPSCGFKCLIPAGNKVFECHNPKCMKESCKLCKRDWEGHFGLPCDQVEVKDESELRTITEEAMTLAVVRRCQKCDTPFVKEAGCNKMTCRCGFMQCYLCHQPVRKNGYEEHYCQHVTENATCSLCNKCILFENAEKEDRAKIERERQLGMEKLIVKGLSVKGKTIFTETDPIPKLGAPMQNQRQRPGPDQAGAGAGAAGEAGAGARAEAHFIPVQLVCFRCGNPGYKVTNCPNCNRGEVGVGAETEAHQLPPQPVCFRCGNPGYKVTNCPNCNRGGTKKKNCFRCGETDHLIRDCPHGREDVSDSHSRSDCTDDAYDSDDSDY